MKITYNSPTILNFSLVAIVVYLLGKILPGVQSYFVLFPGFEFSSFRDLISVVTYGFGHANGPHLVGNLTFILLVGPVTEEKYGSARLTGMIALTLIATALLHKTFFSQGLLGASGIVFMLIILGSFTNVKEGEIPLTFILISVLYIGNEVIRAFSDDQVSQFAHIIGGLCGGFFGLIFRKK